MRKFIEWLLATTALAAIVWGLSLSPLWAGFTASPTGWTVAYELDPTNTDNISVGDDHIRQAKIETRRRLEVEHSFGVNAPDTVDSGRHLEGASRVFMQTTAPTQMQVPDTSTGTSQSLDDGRLWIDSDGDGSLNAINNKLQVYDGAATAWEDVVTAHTVPTNGIILWAEANGDEDCDGVGTAGDCPCGFVRDDEFDGLFLRGAETVAVASDVPEEVGTTCDNNTYSGGALDALCDGAATNYQDTLTTVEMPAHTHTSGPVGNVINNNASIITGSTGGAGTGTTDSTGGGDAHNHPFKTVLFCKKS